MYTVLTPFAFSLNRRFVTPICPLNLLYFHWVVEAADIIATGKTQPGNFGLEATGARC